MKRVRVGKIELLCWTFLLAIWFPKSDVAGIAVISVLKFLGLLWSVYLFINYKLYREKAVVFCCVWLVWCMVASFINGTDMSICFSTVHPIFSTV